MSGSSPAAVRGAQTAVHVLEEVGLQLPFWRYYAMHAGAPYSFLLDSAKDPEKLGRFSFIGSEPVLVYKAKRQHGAPPEAGANIEVTRRRGPEGELLRQPAVERRVADVFDDLRGTMRPWTIEYEAYEGHPVPLLSGAVGYFGYEGGYFIEELPDLGADDLALPDVYLGFYDELLVHSHLTGKTYLSVVGRGSSATAARRTAAAARDRLLGKIAAFEADPPPEWTGPPPTAGRAGTARRAGSAGTGVRKTNGRARRSRRGAGDTPLPLPRIPLTEIDPEVEVYAHFDEAGYCRVVETAKEHIFAGDIFEVCTTHRLESPLVGGTPWELYQELRRINPAPFACFLSFPEAQVVSSSPERFLSLGPNRIAESRPIKGTRPRGATPQEDERIYQDLFGSIKDRAENVMIVDLVRNDFGRVCKFGSVHVPELMIVEQYATVFQMVSTIRGELEDEHDGLDLVRACFPGGSMTGAPKIEAMKIIDRLEPVKRGIYSGSIGYLDFAGPLDLNIVIRTFVVKDGRCYYNVGGAVVADSDPRGEYVETLDKARALVRALKSLKACRGQ